MGIEVPIERKPEYYINNVMGVSASICLCSFSAFAIEIESLGDRLAVVLTMMLTAVAFKMVIADMLPKVAYMTVMDLYLNGLFAFMLLVAIENVLVSTLFRGGYMPEDLDYNLLDLSAFLGFTDSFLLFHLWFAFRVRRAKNQKKESLKGLVRASEASERFKKGGRMR